MSRIRRAVESDLDAIVALINSAEEVREFPDQIYNPADILAHITDKLHKVFIAVDDSKIVGVLSGRLLTSERHGFITFLVVDKKH